MSAVRVNLQPAYVIHTRAFRDTSLIVEVFTPEHGRASLLARGAKSGKGQKALMLQPFRALHVSWSGRGELPTLSAVEEAGTSLRLQGASLACGYYVNELIYYLLPKHEPAAALFSQYWPVVSLLNDEAERETALRTFEFALLEQLGYSPELETDIQSGEPVQRGNQYRFQIPDGPVFAAAHSEVSGVVIGGDTLLDLHHGDYRNPADAKEARDLMRALIHYHLDGRELQSRALFSSFKKMAR